MSNENVQRIDHAEKARTELDFLHEWMSEEGQTDATQIASVLEAQVHATLALEEQQRLSNLISVAMWNSRALVEGARHVDDEPVDLQTEIARVDAIFAEVKTGLGI